jgi:hypothetical protein
VCLQGRGALMDEPERMLDQNGSSLEKALLQEGRAYRGPQNLRAHTFVALGLAGTAGLATSGVLARLATKIWTTKGLLAVTTATLLGVVPVAYLVLHQDAKPVVAPPPSVAAVPQPAPEPIAESPPAVGAESLPPPSTIAPAAVPERSSARVSATRANSALRAELAALDAVRSSLTNDDSVGALSFLDAYFRTYPRGRLHLEAEVLRIDAVAKGGRMNAAKQYAQEFLRRHPNSLLAPRVQSYANP